MTSPIDLASRQEITDLFARYCHAVDKGDAEGWASLFVPDGSFEIAGILRLDGTEQLRGMPGIFVARSGGKGRHQIANIVLDPGQEPNTIAMRAYNSVTDWNDGGKLVTFSDMEVVLRRLDGAWRIQSVLAKAP